MQAVAISGFALRHPHPLTGAEILGLDLGEALTAWQCRALDRLLAARGVLVFRDQSLDPRGFARAIAQFGELLPGDGAAGPVLGFLSNAPGLPAEAACSPRYHSDLSHHPAPPRATALYGVGIPRHGGDTAFSHAQHAHDALPAPLRARLAEARAWHADPQGAAAPRSLHPLVLRHPRTGRRGLQVPAAAMPEIPGLAPAEAEALIALLQRHLADPRTEYRHRWRAGDVLLWDNRTVLHRAHRDVPARERRFLYRVMLRGTPLP